MNKNAVTEIKVATIVITVKRSPRLSLIPGWNYGSTMDITLADGITPQDREVMNHYCDDITFAVAARPTRRK